MQDTSVRDSYFYFSAISTRWNDNDIYGHVNNVVYYSYFDSVANQYLIEYGGLDINNGPAVGFVVASRCEYKAPIAYPDKIDAGFRVNKLGNSSAEYAIAIFKEGQQTACAYGSFTHVFVDRLSGESTTIPSSIRQALELAII